jgi:hypothetical protein
MTEAVRRCGLDLSGAVVLTEAASGAYAVTPVLAALAGARVFALTRATAYGTVDEIAGATDRLGRIAGVKQAITIVTERSADLVSQADIITNSGHVRPLDATMLSWSRPAVVVPLMYEAWELRESDVDLAACAARSIPVAGTNERHPDVDVFSFLGIMAVKLLLDAGIPTYGSRVLVLCDNDFESFITRGLRQAGAEVDVAAAVGEGGAEAYDAVLVALRPRARNVLAPDDASLIARRWPGAVVAQYWGDVDRRALEAEGVPVWPREAPMPGHMGILPSAVGPEPIVRLQAGGLKVGEILSRARRAGASADESLKILSQTGYGTFCADPAAGAGR